MTYKTLQVHVDDDTNGTERIGLAARLAARFEAHLVGLHVMGRPVIPTYVSADIPADVYESMRQSQLDRAAGLKEGFEAAANGAGVAHEWRQVEGEAVDLAGAFALHARYADLAIVGQTDDAGDSIIDLPERAMLESGGPVLVVPYAGRFEAPGKHVTVAWNGTREAARAVNDAMPFLIGAERVSILSINPDGGDPLPGSDIALTLARHGVKVQTERTRGKDIAIGDMLLSRLADEDSDLLVMGGYGHSRMREMVFGGTTRSILEHMTVPVLMAH